MAQRDQQSFVRRWAPRVIVVLAFAVILGVPFALRPEEAETALPEQRAEKQLKIISVHSEAIRTEFERGFRDWAVRTQGFPVDIQWQDVGGTLSAMKYVVDRFKQAPEGIGVDIFFGGGVDPFLEFHDRGLLRPAEVSAEVLERIPQTYAGFEVYDADREWFGACLSAFGVLFNRPVLDVLELGEPDTWQDLGESGYFTWVASADPRLSGSMHMCYEIILQAYGWEKGWEVVTRIGANCRGFSREASSVPKDVSSGDAACGMAIDVYALQAVGEAGGDRLGFVLPEGLTVVNPDGVGILKGAPNPEVADLFIQFVLSDAGQKLWILRPGAPGGPEKNALYRLPLIPGFAEKFGEDAVVDFDPYEFEGGVDFDLEKKNVRWRILNDLLGATIIDVHRELSAAWRRVRKLPTGHPRRRALLKPPISEDELLRLAREEWDSPSFRAQTIARWSAEARARYLRLQEAE